MPNPSVSIAARPLRLVSGLAALLLLCSCGGGSGTPPPDPQLLANGRQIFRFDTFGDEAQWTETLRMHEVIESGVSPATALSVGLKVDAEALPKSLVDALQAGKVDLDSPATTVALIKLDAVVGVKGEVETVNGVDRLKKVGITCALCHSTVDDSFSKGIGKRLDGWPNRDLNPGAIIGLSPASMAEPESPSYAARSATKMYRTSPLRGAWSHAPYFHNGSAATLEDVVITYNQRQQLGLSAEEVKDVAQYLRSL